jgi:hypothetical protein
MKVGFAVLCIVQVEVQITGFIVYFLLIACFQAPNFK